MARCMMFAQLPKQKVFTCLKQCQKHDFEIMLDKNYQYMENQKYACDDPMTSYKTAIESSRNSAYLYKPYKE